MKRMTYERLAEYERMEKAGLDLAMPLDKFSRELLQALKLEREEVKSRGEMMELWSEEMATDRERIAQLEAERDDYKDRWEQTGCTRHGAMEAAIRAKDTALERIAEVEAEVERLQVAHSAYVKTAEASDAYYQARLDAVKNCPTHETTGCDSRGETFAVVYLLKDDVLKALGGDDA